MEKCHIQSIGQQFGLLNAVRSALFVCISAKHVKNVRGIFTSSIATVVQCPIFSRFESNCWFLSQNEERKKSKVLSEIRLIQFAKRIWFPCNDFRTNYFPHFDVYIVADIVRCSLLLLGFFQVFDVLYVQLEAHCDFILCDLLSYVHCAHGF